MCRLLCEAMLLLLQYDNTHMYTKYSSIQQCTAEVLLLYFCPQHGRREITPPPYISAAQQQQQQHEGVHLCSQSDRKSWRYDIIPKINGPFDDIDWMLVGSTSFFFVPSLLLHGIITRRIYSSSLFFSLKRRAK